MRRRRRTKIDLSSLPTPEHRAGFWDDVERGWELREAAGDPGRAVVAEVGRVRRSLLRTPVFVVASAAAVVLIVGAATALLLRPQDEADIAGQSTTTTTAPASTTTTTTAPASTTTTTTVPASSGLPPAPWSGSLLSTADVPAVLVEEWNEAENRLWCSALVPDPTFLTGESAQPRAAEFAGGWAIAWDRDDGPGSAADGSYCSDCGRSAFGIAGTGVTVYDDAAWRQPNVLEWLGGVAGYGGEGFDDDNPKRLAEIVVDGQGCVYQVWSHLGDEHLVALLGSLRLVDGMTAEPVQ